MIISKLLINLSGSCFNEGNSQYPKYVDWENLRFIKETKKTVLVVITDAYGNDIMAIKPMTFDEIMDFIQKTIPQNLIEKHIDKIVENNQKETCKIAPIINNC